MADTPAVVASELTFSFPKAQSRLSLEAFLRALSLRLFDISSIKGVLLGHVKIYGEGNSGAKVKANVTGKRESAQVEVRGFKPTRELRLWINVIAYNISEGELERRFVEAVRRQAEERSAKVGDLSIVRRHRHGH